MSEEASHENLRDEPSRWIVPFLISFATLSVPAMVCYSQFVQSLEAASENDAARSILSHVLTKHFAAGTEMVVVAVPARPGFVDVNYLLSSEPAASIYGSRLKATYPSGFTDPPDFIYLGYLTEDEADLKVLAGYYTDKTANGKPLEDVIPLPTPRPDGRSALLRVALAKTKRPPGSAWANWYPDPAVVPVFIERSYLEGHGGYVIFLDGHAVYYPYARSNVWPCDRHSISEIRKLDFPAFDTTK